MAVTYQLKSSNWTDIEGGRLKAAALRAIGKVLPPRVGSAVLKRGPVDVRHESSNSYLLQIQSIKFIFRWQEPIALSAAVIGSGHICSTVCTAADHHLAI